jgi:DNA-directed RNA polymerase subunit RPC12/RpoP
MMSIDDEIKDMKKYFKRVVVCESCKKPFGLDTKKWGLFCPTCSRQIKKGSNSKVKIKI